MKAAGWSALLLAAGAALAQPPPPETVSSPIPRGTLDPAAPVKPLEETLRGLEQDRRAAPALQRYEAGDYDAAARLGLEALQAGPEHPALRFAVANSLAWTGRYDEAAPHYRALFGTAYDARARVGLGNLLRWRGQAHLAEAHYREVLAREPGQPDAVEGMAFAGRELRPALTLRAASTEDNALQRDEVALAYRRWSADRRWRLEGGVLAGRERSALGRGSPRGLFASAWSPALLLAPRIDALYYDSAASDARLFGTLRLEPIAERLKLSLGRIDWGRAAFSAAADGITARTAGLAAEAPTRLGVARARLDLYDLSDGNRILNGEAQLTPRWQPLPWRLTWFAGANGRHAEREDPRYWSPRPAYALAFAGVQRHWSSDRLEVSASLRYGLGLSSTAGDSWSAGADARYWLRGDLAVGIEAWSVDAPRPAGYRIDHVGAFVQQLL